MTADVETAALRVQHRTRLTRDLTERLSLEMEALRAHRAQDLNEGITQTQEMANLYRRESAQVKANPAAIAIAPEAAARQLVALMDGLQLQWILRDPTAPDAFGMTDDVVTFLRLLGIDLPGDASDTRKARDD